MDVKFYSTHCPKCSVLEKKMQAKGIEYTEINDIKLMRDLGLRAAPALQVDNGPIMGFKDAVEWVDKR